jgi:23S rRNA (pseudouridine1915-N3)-methyltransferase
MRKIYIIYAGNMKEDYFKKAVQEYIKRLSAEFKIDNIEIKEEHSLGKEADRILEKLEKLGRVFKIVLDREGGGLSSEQFAGLLYGERAVNSQGIAFIIGSSHGLADKIKQAADFRLSFSNMTFPHSLFRVMLMEQIYRAYMIEHNRAYHK